MGDSHRLTNMHTIIPSRFSDRWILRECPAGGEPVDSIGAGTLADVAALGHALVEFAGGLTVVVAPLTVGAFLAFDRVAEFCVDGDWWQMRPDENSRKWRADLGRWGMWGNAWDPADLADTACRLVPRAEADADPATRGGDRG